MIPSISASNQQSSDATQGNPNTFYAGSFGSPSVFGPGAGAGSGSLLPLLAVAAAVYFMTRRR